VNPSIPRETHRAEGTLLLTRAEVASLLNLDDCIAAVEQAFRLHGEGKLHSPDILGMHVPGGGFHVKTALLDCGRSYFAAKTNANFPENPKLRGLPAIQGLILLFDGENGTPLAVMDSMEITILRTGAATAVAAKFLARENASVATICGCGNQGRVQLRAVSRVRLIRRVFAYDRDPAQAERFAAEMSRELGVEVTAVRDLAAAVKKSDLCVTCTPSRAPVLGPDDVSPGLFLAAVGADSPEKQELNPALLASSRLVVDILEQGATIGELHHAIEQNVMTRSDVHAELGEIVAGKRPGRTGADEILIFDSTGTALQDAAAAIIVYERALQAGLGTRLDFAACA
jgi:alanine dehydrogenase